VGCSGLNPLKPIEGRDFICLGRKKKKKIKSSLPRAKRLLQD